MQQFVVPQFLDVEDKIVGPITVRQFIIMLAGGLLMFTAYKLSDFVLFIIEGLVIFALTGVVAFLRINGQPFHYFVLNFVQTLKRPRLQVWNKELTTREVREEMEVKEVKIVRPSYTKKRISASRLSELALIVDTGGIYQPEE